MGRQQATYVDILLKDTRLKTIDEVAICMGDRDVWQAMSILAGDSAGLSERVVWEGKIHPLVQKI